jgi:hypothetical protein
LFHNWQHNLAKHPPNAPTELKAEVISATEIQLKWKDVNNEQGFKLYRDGVEIADLPKNSRKYLDSGLKPATTYTYEIQAYNQAGISTKTKTSSKTKNPPIMVRIDKIGVYDNGEDILREYELKGLLPSYTGYGEVYVGIIVTDGKRTQTYHLPLKGSYYKLRDNDTMQVSLQLFNTPEIADYLGIAIVAYEKDGGGVENLLYQALGTVVNSYIGPIPSAIFKASGFSFATIISDICGADDDYLGSYQQNWTSLDNWGVGKYNDITCVEANNKPGFRFWLTIESPLIDAK